MFCGDIFGIDFVYPFVGKRAGINGIRFPAPLIVDGLPRFAICALIQDCRAVTITGTLLNDRVRPLGKPRRITPDNGPPGMVGLEWGDMSHTYCTQLANAPKQTTQQNGQAGKVVRPLKIDIRHLQLGAALMPSQSILTPVDMARNHVPRTAPGIPPALATTGRCDMLAGRASTAWNLDHQSADPAARQANAMRNIYHF